MFCPKCGVQIAETTKYCKSCGMALAPVMDFVASGGNSPLGAPWWSNALSDFSPAHKIWLVTVLLIFGPIVLAALLLFVPLAIVWMLLQHGQRRFQVTQPEIHPGYFQQPQAQPGPTNSLFGPQPQAQAPALQTGSLISNAPGSVIEDDTRRLQNL